MSRTSQGKRFQWHFEDSSLTSKERRELRKQAAEGTRVEEVHADSQDSRLPTTPVPRFGLGFTDGGWMNFIPTRITPHRATTKDLAAVYPFVADGGIGTRGPIMGVDLNADSLFHFSPWESYADESERGTFSTNILVLGAYRAGKSGTMKCLVSRGFAWGYQAVVPGDSKGEWAALADDTEGGIVIRPGGPSGHRINPFDRGPVRGEATEAEDESIVAQRRITTLVQLLEMVSPSKMITSAELTVAVSALNLAIEATADAPTLREIYHQLIRIESGEVHADRKPKAAAEDVRLLLSRFITGDLAGLFEDASTVTFNHEAPIVVVDTSELFQRSELVAQIAQVCTTSWVQAVISDRTTRRRRYVIREEGWRDMTSVSALQMYQQWLKLSRHYGIANVVILHKMGDLDAVGPEGSQERALAYSVVQDIENKFIFHVNRQEEDNLRNKLNLPAPHVQIARRLQKGEFIAYIGSFSYLVDCFATSTPAEFELFKTDDAMITDRAVRGTDQSASPDISIDDLWPMPVTVDHTDAWLAAAVNGAEQ